jgi:uncharacterized protein (TIGR02757 family)
LSLIACAGAARPHDVRASVPKSTQATERLRLERIGAALDELRLGCDTARRLEKDPIAVVHRYSDPCEQELVGLLASAVAFGNAKAFRAKLEQALGRLGPELLALADDAPEVGRRLAGWRHRMVPGDDLGRLLAGARKVQCTHGTLGDFFAEALRTEGNLRGALTAFARAIRDAGGLSASAHVLADPAKASGCKRLLLYLRWMIRPRDGVDLGLWPVPPSVLLVPVDTHVHKLGRNLGFTGRNDASWRTAEEITLALRRFDPLDPVKYDFALCHLGMLQRCPSRRDARRCEGCKIARVCRHWTPSGA